MENATSAPDPAATPAETEVPRVEERVALLSIAGFWAAYYVLNTLRTALDVVRPHEQLAMMGRRAVVVLAAAALTYVLRMVLRRVEHRSISYLITTAFVASIPASIGYAILNYTAFYIVSPMESVRREVEELSAKNVTPVYLVADSAVSWYFFIATWAVLYVALVYAARVQFAERRAAVYRAQAQAAQLRALRYQINPHFLFNTLNSLSALVLRQRPEADRMILNLSTFFRNSLARDVADDVPLAEEIRMQRLYLDIEQVRFPERMAVEIIVPAELEKIQVPGLILQPIVENAIKHGVARTSAAVTITIRATAKDNELRLSVEDNAKSDGGGAAGEGVGLNNVRERLAARFGTAARLEARPLAGGGFRVELSIPLSA